jgi:hypothetical protein
MDEYTKELLDACDVVYRVKASNAANVPSSWYVLGYVAAVQTNDQRNVSRRSEIGSNATILLIDESQKSMSMQRLNAARVRGTAPYNMNLPAMIRYIVMAGVSTIKIMIDIDDPAFNKPFDLEKSYDTVNREDTGTGDPVSKTIYRRCKLAQLTIGIGAASKYLDDGVAIVWEETQNEDIGAVSTL